MKTSSKLTNKHQLQQNNLISGLMVSIGLVLGMQEPSNAAKLSVKPIEEKNIVQPTIELASIADQIFGFKKQTELAIIPFSHEYIEKLKMEQDTMYFQDPNLAHLFVGLQREGKSIISGNIQRVLSYTQLIQEKIEKNAKKTGIRVPLRLIQGLILTESGGDPKIVSRCKAKGLCQFMPGTAKQYKVNVFDPASSIDGAIRKITDDYRRFQDRTYAISAYHMGPGNVNTIKSIPLQDNQQISDATQLVDPNLPDQMINFLYTKKDDTELYFRKIQSAIWLINTYLSDPNHISELECLSQESINSLLPYVKNPDNLRSSHVMSLKLHRDLEKDSTDIDRSLLVSYLSNYVGSGLQILNEPMGSNTREIESIIGAIHQQYPQQGVIIKKPYGNANARLDHILKYHMTQGDLWTSQSGLYYYVVPLREIKTQNQ